MIPDFDVIGFRFGIHYSDFWGHRGFTHSLVFAAILAGLITTALRRVRSEVSLVFLFAYLFVTTASHGLLDAMTNGGLGVAFFSPFDTRRYFLAWRPIRVSPIGIARFFSARGAAILRNEMLWIWLPSAVVIGTMMVSRRWRRRPALPG